MLFAHNSRFLLFAEGRLPPLSLWARLCLAPWLPLVSSPSPSGLRSLPGRGDMPEAGSGSVALPWDPPGASPGGSVPARQPSPGGPGRTGRRPRRPRRAPGAAPAGGVTGGAARLLASRAAAGPLPPSPGAAAGGRMEQGLSAITLYCAPAAGPGAAACAMEPEQVSGARAGDDERPLAVPRPRGGRFRRRARPLGPRRGGRRRRGPAGRGWRFPRGCRVCGPGRGGTSVVCLSVYLPVLPALCNYSQHGGHACLGCLLFPGR